MVSWDLYKILAIRFYDVYEGCAGFSVGFCHGILQELTKP